MMQPCRRHPSQWSSTIGIHRAPVWIMLVLLLGAAALAGCASRAQTTPDGTDPIQSAIEVYLRQERGMDPTVMTIEILESRVEGDTARARVRFSSPGASQGMEFEYRLERRGDGWSVSGGQGAHGTPGRSAHPAGTLPTPVSPPSQADGSLDEGSSS